MIDVKRYQSRAAYGLTEQTAQERLEQGFYNKSVKSPTKSALRIILGNIFTYFNLIFFAIAIALLAVGSYVNLMFLVIVTLNLIIGTIQEIYAKRKLDRLAIIRDPVGMVVREGQPYELALDRMVLDDVVVFSSGNQIFADAQVLDGDVLINESLVTGESDEIQKRAGDMLLSGSFVVSGTCRARLERVGEEAFAAKLTLAAKKAKRHKHAAMMKSLTRLVQGIGVVIIPVGFFLYYRQTTVMGLSVKESIESTAGALVGMIPAGLYLLVSVALAASVVRIAQKRTLVHDFKSVETLARVNVLCLDKTGTITENWMSVSDIRIVPGSGMDAGTIESLLRSYIGNLPVENPTMEAIARRFEASTDRKARYIQPFSSQTRYSLVSFGPDETYCLGAPDTLLGNQHPLLSDLEPVIATGARVLLLAETAAQINDLDMVRSNRISTETIRPLAFLVLENPIRQTASQTFAYFVEQGVTIKVISGDHPRTASSAATKAGIPAAERWIDASVLVTDTDLEQATEAYTVFGRVSPEQKRRIIQALQKRGHTVGMTGDGINDVLALKSADCSIAMASGSEVSSQISDLVLLDSDFDSLPLVVAEGRRVINNIERTASLFLIKNILSFFLAIISISATFPYPLSPSQLSLVSFLTIGLPSFVLALEPNTNLVRGRFLLNVLYRSFPAAMTNLCIVNLAILFSAAFSIADEEISTVATLLMVTVGLIMIGRVSQPFNWKRRLLLGVLLLLLVLILVLIPGLFSLSPLGFGSRIVLFVLILLIPSAMWAFTRLAERVARTHLPGLHLTHRHSSHQ